MTWSGTIAQLTRNRRTQAACSSLPVDDWKMQESTLETLSADQLLNRERVREIVVPRVIESLKNSFGEPSRASYRLERMIGYAIDRFDWYEDQRHRYLQIGLSLIGFAAAYSVLVWRINSILTDPTSVLSAIGAVVLISCGLLLVHEYAKLTSPDYTYRAIADIRSWYFKYTLPENLPMVLSKKHDLKVTQVRAVGKALIEAVDSWAKLNASGDWAFVAEDIEQVFILHFLQKTRRDALSKMRNYLHGGVYVFVTLISSALFLQFITPSVSAFIVMLAIALLVVLVLAHV